MYYSAQLPRNLNQLDKQNHDNIAQISGHAGVGYTVTK